MKFFLLTILFILSAEVSADDNIPRRKQKAIAPTLTPAPIAMPLYVEGPHACNIPLTLILPGFLMAETSCFQIDELASACTCLKQKSVSYVTAANDYLSTKKIGVKAMHEATKAVAMKKLSDGAGVGAMQLLMTSKDVDDDELLKLTEEVEAANSKNFVQRSKDYLTGHGKDKEIKMISNEYIKYMDDYEDCISFSDFSLINNVPKKSFINALNDPKLRPEDFTESTASTSDPDAKLRREAIKDFLLFNLDWQSAFTSGDKKEAYAAIQKIYKDVKPDTFYKAAIDPKEKALTLYRLEQDKNHFFKKQKYAKIVRKTKKEKESEYEDSVEVILANADLISSSPELLDRSLHFQGLPTREECKNGKAEVSDCQTIYVNYCSLKKEGITLTDKERLKIENAFETIDDNAYVMDRYKEVTKKYCSDAKRIDNSSGKIVGPLPETVTFLEFRKMLCVEDTISIKGVNDKNLCKNKQKLMGFFLKNIVDQKLVPNQVVTEESSDDGDFIDQFAQVYSNIEVHSDSDVTSLAKSIALGSGGEDVRNNMVTAMRENQKNSTSGLGDRELLNEVKAEAKPEDAARPVSSTVTSMHEQSVIPKNVVDEANLALAKVAPDIAQNYGLSAFFPNMAAKENLVAQKTVADTGVTNIEKRIDRLVQEQEIEKADAQNTEIEKLKAELSSLKDYSKSITKLIDEKTQKVPETVLGSAVSNKTSTASDKSISRQIASIPNVNDQNPSTVYDDYFGDANFHPSAPLGQSAIINRQIIDATGSNDALNAVYGNQVVKSVFQNGESGSGNMILMSSPIEITEAGETKFPRQELQVEQVVLDEIRSSPEKLKAFFTDQKIDHIGILTLRASSSSVANYIVRKDNEGKLLVVPVNIARKSKLDDLKRTLQVQAF